MLMIQPWMIILLDHIELMHLDPPGHLYQEIPNLPPDEEVLAEQIEEEDEMEVDEDQHMDDEFVNGRFDL